MCVNTTCQEVSREISHRHHSSMPHLMCFLSMCCFSSSRQSNFINASLTEIVCQGCNSFRKFSWSTWRKDLTLCNFSDWLVKAGSFRCVNYKDAQSGSGPSNGRCVELWGLHRRSSKCLQLVDAHEDVDANECFHFLHTRLRPWGRICCAQICAEHWIAEKHTPTSCRNELRTSPRVVWGPGSVVQGWILRFRSCEFQG